MITRVKVTFWDFVLILFLLAVSGIWFVFMLMRAQPGMAVGIHNKDGLYQEIRLDEDATITVPGPLGDSVVRIEDHSVFMVSSPCPGKVCINLGKIRYAGEGIACIPNRVYVAILGGKRETDSISY